MDLKERIQTFTSKAEAVAAIVTPVADVQQALEHIVTRCVDKDACQPLASGCEHPLSREAADLCRLDQWSKIIAAPGLAPEELSALTDCCRPRGIRLVDTGLHSHLGGVDIGVTWAQYGIAENGTLVLDSSREEARLAGMISEIHAVLLAASTLYATAEDLLEPLTRLFGNGPNYTAFITGASRTADIERVLALGVHGPLELQVYIIQDS
jgi:L-lactate dehydrogenase complex protein LldG